jgi:hypothetical protein
VTRRAKLSGGTAGSAVALFLYAAAFSLAYVRIGAGVGALLLVGSVQATMVEWTALHGTGPRPAQVAVLTVAPAGLAWLGLPGAVAPDVADAALRRVSVRPRLQAQAAEVGAGGEDAVGDAGQDGRFPLLREPGPLIPQAHGSPDGANHLGASRGPSVLLGFH